MTILAVDRVLIVLGVFFVVRARRTLRVFRALVRSVLAVLLVLVVDL